MSRYFKRLHFGFFESLVKQIKIELSIKK